MQKTILLSFLFSLLFVSCKKGDVGPAGPQGAQGPPASSYTFTLTFSSSKTVLSYSIIPAISANDAVLIYALNRSQNGEDYYVLLPFMESTSGAYFWAETGTGGTVYVHLEDYTPASSFPVQFKAVVIKGMNSARVSAPPVDLSDYQAVKKHYGFN